MSRIALARRMMPMEKSDEQPPELRSGLTARRVIGGILATLLLGALGSGLWDLLFRPGVYRIGSFLTTISSAADDAVFTTAALDPRPVPILIILLIVSMIPVWVVSWILIELFVKPPVLGRLRPIIKSDDEAAKQRMRGRLKTLLISGSVVMLGLSFVVQVGYSIANEAVCVWRVFDKNLDICAPILTQEEQRQFVAQFRKMQHRSDFESIRLQLDSVATKRGERLDWRQ